LAELKALLIEKSAPTHNAADPQVAEFKKQLAEMNDELIATPQPIF
jgi:hypothetical protein